MMKYLFSAKGLTLLIVSGLIVSCKSKTSGKEFEVSGTFTNSNAKMVYLEQLPMATMQRIVVDSSAIDKNGKYSLKTNAKEESTFDLRLDQNTFPITSVINDQPQITLDGTFSNDSDHILEKYEVKGSPASQQLKDFLYAFTDRLQNIYISGKQVDSLQGIHAPDSIIHQFALQQAKEIAGIRDYTLQEINKSNSPSLTMFELGYYQTTANNPEFKVEGLGDDEVSKIINDLYKRFPSNEGLAGIKKSLDEQLEKKSGWVGKEAPEIALPDVNGNIIKLSSFRGKYVLVDFWASWCSPCRHENPNVVKAYNEFKDKNFTILGVSLDKPGEKDKWMKAIKDDNLTWPQVSELKYWDSEVVLLYNIEGIPYNVLVDPSGKVIAEGLRGDALEAKLQQVLK